MGVSETNFLEKYRGLRSLGLPDLLEIWNHYDRDESGYIEAGPELERFLTDMLRAAKAQDGNGSDEIGELELRDFITGILELYDIDSDGRLDLGEIEQLLNEDEDPES